MGIFWRKHFKQWEKHMETLSLFIMFKEQYVAYLAGTETEKSVGVDVRNQGLNDRNLYSIMEGFGSHSICNKDPLNDNEQRATMWFIMKKITVAAV